ncbi:alpha/beta-hydrolase [Daedaleopsis nitida]|nr:alpha/beta-hydrolase [Daedaleopsis nitida]
MLSLQTFPLLTPLLATQVVHAWSGRPGGSGLEWGPCDPLEVTNPRLDCAYLTVPLDYHDPSVGNASIAMVKANATGERRGTVFYNPGGPGGPGLEVLNDTETTDFFLSLSGGVYDLVSWDPRGVGNLPGEIYCFDSVEEYNSFWNGTIELTGIEETGNFTDPEDIQALLSQASIMQEKYRQFEQKCLDGPSGKYLQYIGTAATVRDMVSMADAIDGPDTPINYIGISYGTLIGAWFVNMFPERVGRVIINGVINPQTFATEETSTVWDAKQYESADTIYKGIITACALAGPQGCAAASEGDGPLDVDANFQALINGAHDAARKNASAPLTSSEIRAMLKSTMYQPITWSAFLNDFYPSAVKTVAEESGHDLSNNGYSKFQEQRRRHILRPRESQRNETRPYSFEAIFCGDSVDIDPNVNMTDVFNAIINGTQTISHTIGSIWPSLTCSFWPVRAVERYQGPWNSSLANKILIASSTASATPSSILSDTYDPVTPLSGAQALAGFLGDDDAALVRLNSFGHSSNAEPSACMHDIFVAYMVNGTVPANNTVCDVDSDYEVLPGVTTADILANLPSSDI